VGQNSFSADAPNAALTVENIQAEPNEEKDYIPPGYLVTWEVTLQGHRVWDRQAANLSY
jgi:hypothetical protein